MLRRKRFYAAWFVLHFLLIIAISSRETLWLIAHRLTILPASLAGVAQDFEPVASAALAQNLASSNPLRRGLLTYFHLAGIDRSYDYFAPNIPGTYMLVFEVHYPDERVGYEVPKVNSRAAGLRVASLLDEIGRTRSGSLREYLIKGMTRSIWREHPDATKIRALFAVSTLPAIGDYEKGKRESYELLYTYDFSVQDNSGEARSP